ncbi:MAG: EAL domain-containing protein [Ectothiorhodospiraceae bacterium]|nr:EAL domain-containing protein [Ectothiorhodospiraceae bacterium]
MLACLLAGALLVGTGSATWLGYQSRIAADEREVSALLGSYALERARRESVMFALTQERQATFRTAFLAALTTSDRPALPAFHALMARLPDGSYRLRSPAARGAEARDWPTGLGVYVAPTVTVDEDLAHRVVTALELVARLGPLWGESFPNLYVSLPEGVSIDYWPAVAWTASVDADLDLNTQEWFYVAEPKHNPRRQAVWTGIYHDAPADAWMTSCITPIDRDGVHVAAVGNDLLLADLRARVADDRLDGTTNVVLRTDGRLIAAAGYDERLLAAGGEYVVDPERDPALGELLGAARGASDGDVVRIASTGDLAAITHIEGPGWIFAVVYPAGALAERAATSAREVLWLGVVGAGLVLLLASGLLNLLVVRPLRALEQMAAAVAHGAPRPARWVSALALSRRDEIGRLARAFAAMETRVASHHRHLEARIAERTQALEASMERVAAERERARHHFERTPALIVIIDRAGVVGEVNQRACEALGVARDAIVGHDWFAEFVSARDRDRVRAAVTAAFAGTSPMPDKLEYRLGDDRERALEVVWGHSLLTDASGAAEALLTAGEDVTRRRLAERELARRGEVLELMTGNPPLADVLAAIARTSEELRPGMRCSILLLDADGLRLRPGAAPSLPRWFADSVDGITIGPQVGTCGTAAYLRRRVITPCIADDPAWAPIRDLAARAGVAACWSDPIVAGDGAVLGTFAMYYDQPGTPLEDDLRVIGSSVALARLAIERDRASRSQRLAAAVFDNTAEAVFAFDAEGRVMLANRALSRMTGRSELDLLGAPAPLVGDADEAPETHAKVWAALARDGSWRGEVEGSHRDGSRFPALLNVIAIGDGAERPSHHVAVMSDLTEIKHAEARIRHLAYHDALTGLPNRALLADRIAQALGQASRHGRGVALAYLDLDRFKSVNDSLGHHAGDALLCEVARRLRECVRETDTVARLGGDEFVVLLVDTDEAEASVRVVREIFDALEAPVIVQGQALHVGASIGVSLYPDDAPDAATLMRHADTAMYHAKAEGRGRYSFFLPEMDARTHTRFRLESELRAAVAAGQLEMHYQPVVRQAPDEVVESVEALLRWNHPSRGLLRPEAFLDVAEDCGLATTLGELALHTACAAARRWHRAGYSALRVGVNVSASQLRRPDFAATVRTALESNGLRPESLELELTESALLEDTDTAIRTLRELDVLGVSLALDDFGTGYSSLAHLQRFPFRRLKIDRVFVAEIAERPGDRAITAAVIALAHALGMGTVAEGVEHEGQAQILRALGCDALQGHLLGHPMPEAELSALLAARAAVGATTDDRSRAQASGD